MHRNISSSIIQDETMEIDQNLEKKVHPNAEDEDVKAFILEASTEKLIDFLREPSSLERSELILASILGRELTSFSFDDVLLEELLKFISRVISKGTGRRVLRGMEGESSTDSLVQILLDRLSCPCDDPTEIGFIADDERRLCDWVFNALKKMTAEVPQMEGKLPRYFENIRIFKKGYSEVYSSVFDSKIAHQQVCAVKNMLQLCSHFPGQRRKILEITIRFILKIDVRCSRDTIVEAEQSREMFMMDEDASVDDDVMVDGPAYILDLLMDLMMSYIRETCYGARGLNPNNTRELFGDLICIFNNMILPTYKCCHVQFLLFYVCSFKLELSDAFLDGLWNKTTNVNLPPNIRHNAVCYIGSFLARSAFVSIDTIKSCLKLMVQWIHDYIKKYDGLEFDSSAHDVFYSVFQVIAYIVAYPRKEMLLVKNTAFLQKELLLGKVATCKLNPLKFCDEEVLSKFSSILHDYQIAQCISKIKENSRLSLKTNFTRGDQIVLHRLEPSLDFFLPFEPYVLKKSGRHVNSFYRQYSEEPISRPPQRQNQNLEDDDFLNNDDFSSSLTVTSPGHLDKFPLHSPRFSLMQCTP